MKLLFRNMMWLILSALILSSCGYKKQAKEVTKDFFSAIKNEKEEKMAELYPDVGNLQNYYKSDTIIFKEVIDLGDNKYSVSVTNKFTNYIFRSIPVQHSGSAVSSQKCKNRLFLMSVRP